MTSIAEKRVYGTHAGAHDLFVAADMGVLRARVAAGQVGEYGLIDTRQARDVSTSAGVLAVATETDILIAEIAETAENEDHSNKGLDSIALAETGFGPAVTVWIDEDAVIGVGDDGTISDLSRLDRGPPTNWSTVDGEDWRTIDRLDSAVRGIDGDLLATADGVYRIADDGLTHVGLSAVYDVSTPGIPLAATADGLYALGNGWMCERDGSFDVVAGDSSSDPGRLTRGTAGADHLLYSLSTSTGEWTEVAAASAPIADVAHADETYAVTVDGTILASRTGEWHSDVLGVNNVSAVAIHSEYPDTV